MILTNHYPAKKLKSTVFDVVRHFIDVIMKIEESTISSNPENHLEYKS